jgi:hypothetical protein
VLEDSLGGKLSVVVAVLGGTVVFQTVSVSGPAGWLLAAVQVVQGDCVLNGCPFGGVTDWGYYAEHWWQHCMFGGTYQS